MSDHLQKQVTQKMHENSISKESQIVTDRRVVINPANDNFSGQPDAPVVDEAGNVLFREQNYEEISEELDEFITEQQMEQNKNEWKAPEIKNKNTDYMAAVIKKEKTAEEKKKDKKYIESLDKKSVNIETELGNDLGKIQKWLNLQGEVLGASSSFKGVVSAFNSFVSAAVENIEMAKITLLDNIKYYLDGHHHTATTSGKQRKTILKNIRDNIIDYGIRLETAARKNDFKTGREERIAKQKASDNAIIEQYKKDTSKYIGREKTEPADEPKEAREARLKPYIEYGEKNRDDFSLDIANFISYHMYQNQTLVETYLDDATKKEIIKCTGGDTATINRRLGGILKPAYLDKKGEPITEKDKINHEWNKHFIECMASDETEKRTEMIDELLKEYNEINITPEMLTLEWVCANPAESSKLISMGLRYSNIYTEKKDRDIYNSLIQKPEYANLNAHADVIGLYANVIQFKVLEKGYNFKTSVKDAIITEELARAEKMYSPFVENMTEAYYEKLDISKSEEKLNMVMSIKRSCLKEQEKNDKYNALTDSEKKELKKKDAKAAKSVKIHKEKARAWDNDELSDETRHLASIQENAREYRHKIVDDIYGKDKYKTSSNRYYVYCAHLMKESFNVHDPMTKEEMAREKWNNELTASFKEYDNQMDQGMITDATYDGIRKKLDERIEEFMNFQLPKDRMYDDNWIISNYESILNMSGMARTLVDFELKHLGNVDHRALKRYAKEFNNKPYRDIVLDKATLVSSYAGYVQDLLRSEYGVQEDTGEVVLDGNSVDMFRQVFDKKSYIDTLKEKSEVKYLNSANKFVNEFNKMA